jgi:plasmid stability protein
MQNACMTTITIRDVPEETHAELVARAKAAGKSLQEYLRAKLIEVGNRPDMATLMARIEKRVQEHPNTLTTEKILEYRDLGRR